MENARNKEEEQMDSRARLDAWLKPVPADKHPADPFELAVAQGMAAQETAAEALRNFLEIGETDVPNWLTLWAANLTSDEVETIKARRDAEEASLRQDIELLLGDDPEKWTETERAHAEKVQKRLMAANLVLRAREKTTHFLPKSDKGKKATIVAA